jgi:hypothetical protein
MHMRTPCVLLFIASLAGCMGLPPPGPVPPYPAPYGEVRAIGNDAYQIAGFGSTVTWTAPEVKAALNQGLNQGAGQFCAKDGKQVVPLTATSSGSPMTPYATAQIQFRCE